MVADIWALAADLGHCGLHEDDSDEFIAAANLSSQTRKPEAGLKLAATRNRHRTISGNTVETKSRVFQSQIFTSL